MDEKIKLLISTFGEHRIKVDEPLRFHTASQLSATAKAFFIATSAKELKDILDAAHDLKIPFWIIGTGTKFSFPNSEVYGLVIKNRTSLLKIGAVKGKVGKDGIGVEEAMVEVDSGVSIGKLNEFLVEQKLQTITTQSAIDSTLGGVVWTDFGLQFFVQKVIVWKNGEVEELEVRQLDKTNQVILSIVLKVGSK